MTEMTPETRMMDSMMRAMNAAMTQQQEFFMKLLEDRDASHRRLEATAGWKQPLKLELQQELVKSEM